jgi:hypothetical protein
VTRWPGSGPDDVVAIGDVVVRRAQPSDAAAYSRADARMVGDTYASLMPPQFAADRWDEVDRLTGERRREFAEALEAERRGEEPPRRTWVATQAGDIAGIAVSTAIALSWRRRSLSSRSRDHLPAELPVPAPCCPGHGAGSGHARPRPAVRPARLPLDRRRQRPASASMPATGSCATRSSTRADRSGSTVRCSAWSVAERRAQRSGGSVLSTDRLRRLPPSTGAHAMLRRPITPGRSARARTAASPRRAGPDRLAVGCTPTPRTTLPPAARSPPTSAPAARRPPPRSLRQGPLRRPAAHQGPRSRSPLRLPEVLEGVEPSHGRRGTTEVTPSTAPPRRTNAGERNGGPRFSLSADGRPSHSLRVSGSPSSTSQRSDAEVSLVVCEASQARPFSTEMDRRQAVATGSSTPGSPQHRGDAEDLTVSEVGTQPHP